jgi:uncharacterized protein with von Willebrand factor type A (vWA) domain
MIAYRYARDPLGQRNRRPGLNPDSLLRALSRHLLEGYNLSTAMDKFKWDGLIDLDEERVHGLGSMLEQVRGFRANILKTWSLEGILDDIGTAVRGFCEESQNASRSGPTAQDLPRSKKAELAAVRDWINSRFPDDLARWLHALIQIAGAQTAVGQHIQNLYSSLLQRVGGLEHLLRPHCTPEAREIGPALRDLRRLLAMASNDHNPNTLIDFATDYSHLFEIEKGVREFAATVLNRRRPFRMLMMSIPYRLRLALETFLESSEWAPLWVCELEPLWRDLEKLVPMAGPKKVDFRGSRSLGLDPALSMMDKLWKLDELEKTILRGRLQGDLTEVEGDLLGELLGELARHSFEKLSQIADILIEGGYLNESSDGYSLSSKALRRIGEFALREAFQGSRRWNVARRDPAAHSLPDALILETKKYEYGDALHLDISQTILSAVKRSPGAVLPLSIVSDDFEVYIPERFAKTSTVLLLDMSSSMEQALPKAKKVALSLSRLLETRFPNDKLSLVGFYTLAQQMSLSGLIRIKTQPFFAGHVKTAMEYQALKRLQNEDPLSFPADFTNLQEGLRLCRRYLQNDRHYQKHIFLITDGEPTACTRDGWVHLEHPPSPLILHETLREVQKCTQRGIRITVFMLSSDNRLAEFVKTMAKINKGRAVISSSENLPGCVLVDYLRNKMRRSELPF